jgi:hypothetical protein
LGALGIRPQQSEAALRTNREENLDEPLTPYLWGRSYSAIQHFGSGTPMNLWLQVATIVAQLGYGVASDAIYDYLKTKFEGRTQVATTELEGALNDYLILNGVHADASTIMTLLAERGVISVHSPISMHPIS